MRKFSFEKLEQIFLNYVSELFYQILVFEITYWWLFGLVGGALFILGWVLQKTFLGVFFRLIGSLIILFQPGLFFVGADLAAYLWGRLYEMPVSHLYADLGGVVLSTISGFYVFQYLIAKIDSIKNVLIKKSGLERDLRSDIRKLDANLPKGLKLYNPEKYFRKSKRVFIGLNKKSKPNCIDADIWRSSHIDVIGTTGSGKGVIAGSLLSQSILQGETVVVIDPKNDEWLPHVLANSAKKNKVKFFFIDLTCQTPQWNPFYNKNKQEIEELLAAGFGMSEKGTDADFYRLNDRKSARYFSEHCEFSGNGFPEDFSSFIVNQDQLLQNSPKFVEDLEELASLPVTRAVNGINIHQEIKNGSVIYVKGSIRNPKILKAQKMFVLSIMQACENRQRDKARHVCIFMDEFKYLISKPSLEALGAIRDKKAHVILAHQSLGDLRDCPKDIDPDAVVASVNENCAIKIAYKVRDPDTADWLARMSGKILIDDEMRSVNTTGALAEVKNPDRFIRQSERCLIDTNMLQSLPTRCAVLYGNGLADFIFTSPLVVKKNKQFITPTVFEVKEQSKPNDKTVSVAEDLLDVG